MLMRFVIPSMLSMLTAGVYTIVDGLFVGWGAGSDGMAALNVAYPLALLLVAVGEMIGIGGAVTLSIARGRGAYRAAENILNTMLRIVIPAGLLLPLFLLPFLDPVLRLLGAAPVLMESAREYALIIVGAGVFQMAAMSLLEAMRNDNSPHRAMGILICGLVANVILDYLFVIRFRFGVAGSAWATVIAQGLCLVLALQYFCSKRAGVRLRFRKWRLRKMLLGRLLRAGIPSFGVQLSIGLVIWLHNNRALHYGGVNAVAAYAIISYLEASILLLIQGIALGLQPIVSFLHGAGKFFRRGRMAGYGLILGVVAGIVGMMISGFGASRVAEIFNAHGEVFMMAVAGLQISAPVYPMLGFQKISESYFQSMERTGAASLLIYLDSCVILPVCLFVLPLFFGLSGVWAAMPAAKIPLVCVVLILWHKGRKYER